MTSLIQITMVSGFCMFAFVSQLIGSSWQQQDELEIKTESLQIFPKKLKIIAGEKRQLILYGTVEDRKIGLTSAAQWVSKNPEIIGVDDQGLLTGGPKKGETVIEARHKEALINYTAINRGKGRYIYFLKPNDWGQAWLYSWIGTGKAKVEPTGPWPGALMRKAEDLGSSWQKYFVNDDFFNKAGLLNIIFSYRGERQTEKVMISAQDGASYFSVSGPIDEKPLPAAALDGTQVQVQSGRLSFPGDSSNLGGKLFVEEQVLEVSADIPGPGQYFVSWEGSGAPYLVDSHAPQSKLVVADKASMTLFAIFEPISDSYAEIRKTYGERCSGCHGMTGNGRPSLIDIQKRYTQSTLTELIHQSMPKYNPGICIDQCASEMAQFLLDQAFEPPQGLCQDDSLESLIPAERSLRLLTSTEYDHTVRDLLHLPSSYSIKSQLPEDFIVNGFQSDANSTFSKQHGYGYFQAALTLARLVEKPEDLQLDCGSDYDCLVKSFGRRAFRRPLSSTEISRYKRLFQTFGLEGMLIGFLTSPHLLYRSELGQPSITEPGFYQLTDYEIASYLSYTFWRTMPDDQLLNLAEQGKLHTPQQIKSQARRLIADPRARLAFRSFLDGWLNLNKPVSADLPDSLKNSFKQEMQKFVEYIIFDDQGSFEDLMLSKETFVNDELATHYGIEQRGDGWHKIETANTDRVGILGKAHYLTVNATTTASHPIKRGLFVRRNLLCQDFPPPPIGAELNPVHDPDLTTREKFEVSHRQNSCLSCHQFIDGIGFGLESYDQKGLSRQFERVPSGLIKEINSQGQIGSLDSAETILSSTGPVKSFDGIADLSQLITESRNGKACFARQYYRYVVGEDVVREQNCTLAVYGKEFKSGDHNVIELMVQWTQTKNFGLRR